LFPECRKHAVSAVDRAILFEITPICALTAVPVFFEKLGFSQIDKHELPHKVWADCINCPHFPDCDELTVRIDLP